VRAERVPAAGAPFEDRATLSFVNRQLPVPRFSVQNTSTWCNLSVAGGLEVALRKAAVAPPPPVAPPAESSCDSALPSTDAVCNGACDRAGPVLYGQTEASCCAACDKNAQCGTWVLSDSDSDSEVSSCFLLVHGTVSKTKPAPSEKTLGGEVGQSPAPPRPSFLRAEGVLQAFSTADGWAWRAWEPELANLLGTLKGTAAAGGSADLAGCCTNPNATAGEYDTKAAYVLQPGLLSRAGCTAVDDSTTPLYDIVGGDLDDAWLSNVTAAPAVAGREDLYLFGCGTDLAIGRRVILEFRHTLLH
jgi:hypothetical protein